MKSLARAALTTLLRFVLRLVYRVRSAELANIPAEGGLLLVANHVTFIDAFILGLLCPRPVRFVMDHRYFDHPLFGWFCRLFGAIPIATRREDPARLRAAMDAVDAALANGEVVAIFPEGRLTRDGQVGAFRPGVERILRRQPVPVLPLAIRGLWGSLFSRAQRRALRLRRRVELVAGPLLGPDTPAERMRAVVLDLQGEHA